MGRAFSNPKYHIRRSNLLRALGLPDKIPVGYTHFWYNVQVVTGRWDDAREGRPEHYPRETIVLPFVQVVEKGVAKRIQVECPECRKVMRFSGLQQHVGSPTCKKALEALRCQACGNDQHEGACHKLEV